MGFSLNPFKKKEPSSSEKPAIHYKKGERVSFFHGRGAKIGEITEVREHDGTVVVRTEMGGGTKYIVLEEDQVRPYDEVRGTRMRVRFRRPG